MRSSSSTTTDFCQLNASFLFQIAAHAPSVMLTPADSIVKDPSNEELVLECDATGVPKPKILWLWSGHLIEDGKVYTSIHTRYYYI